MTARIVTASLLVFLFTKASFAVLPPLSEKQRQELATHIVEGYVLDIKKSIEERPYGTDALYTVRVLVLASQKGESFNGKTLTFHYWKADYRPQGWCGDGGQNKSIHMYSDIKAYLTHDSELDRYELLSPNGFDELN